MRSILFGLFLFLPILSEAWEPAPLPFPIGVVDAPCAYKKLSTADPNDMVQHFDGHELVPDFGQLCIYEAENASLGAHSDKRIVFMGDSITQGWNLAALHISGRELVNRGISGETTAQMLLRFKADVLDLKPAAVHILAGTNDIAGNTGPTTLARIEGNIEMMADLAKAHGIRVVLASVLPAQEYSWRKEIKPVPSIKALNHWLQVFAAKRGFAYLDYYNAMEKNDGLPKSYSEDGVHPNETGYAKMNTLVTQMLSDVIK